MHCTQDCILRYNRFGCCKMRAGTINSSAQKRISQNWRLLCKLRRLLSLIWCDTEDWLGYMQLHSGVDRFIYRERERERERERKKERKRDSKHIYSGVDRPSPSHMYLCSGIHPFMRVEECAFPMETSCKWMDAEWLSASHVRAWMSSWAC
jgi:hypothetical protein